MNKLKLLIIFQYNKWFGKWNSSISDSPISLAIFLQHFQGHPRLAFELALYYFLCRQKELSLWQGDLANLWTVSGSGVPPDAKFLMPLFIFSLHPLLLPHQWIIYKSRVCMKLKQNAHKFCNEGKSRDRDRDWHLLYPEASVCLSRHDIPFFLAEGLVFLAQAFNINEL